MASVTEYWNQYEHWLELCASEVLLSLNPGLSDERLNEFGHEINMSLPSDYLEFYRLHDGQPWDSPWVFPEGQWLPLKQVYSVYTDMLSGGDWNSNLLPIIYDGGSGYIVFCCRNDGDYKLSALYDVWFEENSIKEVSPSIENWLRLLVENTKLNKVIYDRDMGLYLEEQ